MAAVLDEVQGGLATFTLKANGQALPGTFRVIAVDIIRELDRITSAAVVLQDGDAAAQDFAASASDELAPGTELEIDGGYDRDESRLFKGVVTRQRIEASRGGDTFLHLEAKDPVFRSALARGSRTFIEISDADAISELLTASGATVEIDATEVQPQIVQHQVSDWDFALQRARAMGLVCDCDGDKVRFFAPDLAASAARSFEFGRDLHRMDLELDAESQFDEVEAGAWSPPDQELLLAEAADISAGGDSVSRELLDVGEAKPKLRQASARGQGNLDSWAASRLTRSRLAAVRGTVEVQGTDTPVPGDMVELKGLGSRFSGTVFVSGVHHRLGQGDWMTTLQLGLEPRPLQVWSSDAAAPPAGGLIPPIHGLHIGVVNALEGDPLGEDRIQLSFPTADGSEGLVWARLATLEAGSERGTVFRPDVRDEVVVGFLDSDPRDPVVLGALHSSAHPAPLPGRDDNHEKAYVSRQGMRLLFDDNAPSVLIETPAGAQLKLDDSGNTVELTDQSGNLVKLSDSTLEFSAISNLEIKAVGDLTIEGRSVSLSALTEAKVSGTTAAKLESSGQTTVKGSLVMIN